MQLSSKDFSPGLRLCVSLLCRLLYGFSKCDVQSSSVHMWIACRVPSVSLTWLSGTIWLVHALLRLLQTVMLLSAGFDEAFSSPQQLLQCVRPGILLDAASVPSVQMTNRNGQGLPLNRYILDYWGHGQKQALVHANGLREGVLLFCF